MLHFGRKQLFVFVLLLYIAVLEILKCLEWSDPNQHSSDADIREMARNSTGTSSRCRRQLLEGRLLLTLFTTFRDSLDRHTIHVNTINNWSKLRSFGVQPILYVVNLQHRTSSQQNATDWSTVDYARQSGWIVRPYDHVSTTSRPASRAPVLRHMFIDAERTSRSLFYGYANGDITFDEGLPTTLLEIIDEVVERYSELIITGVRTDCVIDAYQDCTDISKSSQTTTHTQLQPTNMAMLYKYAFYKKSENGRLSSETTTAFPRRRIPYPLASGSTSTPLKNAQDYFITKRSGFPWSTIPDFVVGRAGVDNWLLVTALARRAAVVDASRTITARHQVRSDYNPSAHFTQPTGDATVNYALAGRSFDYSLGLTDCAPLETRPAPHWSSTAGGRQARNYCIERATVVLRRRTLNRYCQRAYVKLRGLHHRLSRGINSQKN